MKPKIRIRKIYYIIGGILLVLFLLLFFLSTIARIWLVKNSEDLIGRKVDLKELHLNYLRFSVKAENFIMFEKNSKDTFVSFSELYVNFEPWKLLKKEYAFSEIRLVKPMFSVVYADSGFNFDDLLSSADTVKTDTVKEELADTVKYLVKNLNLNGGFIRYEDKTAKSITELKELGIRVPEISWNSRQSKAGIDFILGKEGKVSLGGRINQAAGKYSVTLKTSNIDIEPYGGYLKPYMNISRIAGKLNTDLRLSGDMSHPENLKIFGGLKLENLIIDDIDKKQFCSLKDILVDIDSLDLGNSNYRIKKVRLDDPHFTTVLEPGTTNIERVLAPLITSDSSEVAADTSENAVTTVHYAIDQLDIKSGNIDFSDLTLNRPFYFNISNLNINLSGFSDNSPRVPVIFSMNLNEYGTFKGTAVLDMVNSSNIVFDGSIANLNMVSLSPYSEYYLARPVTRGTFNYTGRVLMTPKSLDSRNSPKIVNLEFGKKTKDTTAYKVPVCLALYILKDRNGIIGFDLPITGNPSEPAFSYRKILWKTLEEFLLKTVSEPFKALGKMIGSNPESIKQIPFKYLQDTLTDDQLDKLGKISEIILKKPEITFAFSQTTDPEKEKELLALHEAKYSYAIKNAPAGTGNSELEKVATGINNLDPAFLAFIGIKGDSTEKQIVNSSMEFIGKENILLIFNQLLAKREKLLRDYFNDKKIPPGSVSFKINDFRNLPDEMKTPGFVIEVLLKQ